MERISRKLSQALRSLENPLYLSKRFKWLYWKIYGFTWSNYVWLLDNTLARFSPAASAAGYLIYLNDFLVTKFGFEFVTRGEGSAFGLDIRLKLAMIYFGLIFVAMGRGIYLARRPNVILHGPMLSDWVAFGLQNFVFSDYSIMHHEIQNGHRTLYGKYYTDTWEAFKEDAVWEQSGRSDGMDTTQKRNSREHVGFAQAKQRHEDLLRSILIDRYYERAASRKVSLFFSVLLAAFGSVLFLIPSLDLFFSILFTFL
jgi:hypothetical protein